MQWGLEKEADALAAYGDAYAITKDPALPYNMGRALQAQQAEMREHEHSALAEVQAQESARDNKTADLTKKSEEGGAVSRNKAKAELAAHLAEDPLPLLHGCDLRPPGFGVSVGSP